MGKKTDPAKLKLPFGECADRAGVGRTGHIVIGQDHDIERCGVVNSGCDNRLEMAKALGGPSSEPVISENSHTSISLEDRWKRERVPGPLARQYRKGMWEGRFDAEPAGLKTVLIVVVAPSDSIEAYREDILEMFSN